MLLLLGLNVWIGFFSSTCSQLLMAAERFDLQMVSDVIVLALRTAATVWVLSTGRGLVPLAVVTVGSGLLGCVLVTAMARSKGPRVHIHRRHLRWTSFREVFSFGSWSFLGQLSAQLGLYASSAIIGMLIGAAEITFYTIGATLIGYAATFVGNITQVIVPDMLKAGGRGDQAHLRWLMGKGTRATMFFAVPILVGFMTLGGEFIAVWMGRGYAATRLGVADSDGGLFWHAGQRPGQHDVARPGPRAALRGDGRCAIVGRPGAFREPDASDGLGDLRDCHRHGLAHDRHAQRLAVCRRISQCRRTYLDGRPIDRSCAGWPAQSSLPFPVC